MLERLGHSTSIRHPFLSKRATKDVYLNLGTVWEQLLRGSRSEITTRHDVVAVEHRARLVASQLHRDALRDAPAKDVSHCGSPEVVWDSTRAPCGAAGGCPSCSYRDLAAGRTWWDNPTMVVTLDAKRRLTVPSALAPAKPGDYFDARFDPEEDAIVFRRLGGQESWLTVMKECPVSPDDVPPRRRAPAKRRKL
jgi:hypothetical protein